MSRTSRTRSIVVACVAAVTAPLLFAAPAAAGTDHPAGHPAASKYQQIPVDDGIEVVLKGTKINCVSGKDYPELMNCQGLNRKNGDNIASLKLNKGKRTYGQANMDLKQEEFVTIKEGESGKRNFNGTVVMKKNGVLYFSNPHFKVKGEITPTGVKFTS